jgi:hypothetical protein
MVEALVSLMPNLSLQRTASPPAELARWPAMPKIAAFCATVVVACIWPATVCAAEPGVDVMQLIAHPAKYTGKLVSVSALVTVEFENMTLCSISAKVRNIDSCVWLEIDSGPYESAADELRYKKALASWTPFNRKQVIVRGVFVGGQSGHFGMWSGAISQVASVKVQ